MPKTAKKPFAKKRLTPFQEFAAGLTRIAGQQDEHRRKIALHLDGADSSGQAELSLSAGILRDVARCAEAIAAKPIGNKR